MLELRLDLYTMRRVQDRAVQAPIAIVLRRCGAGSAPRKRVSGRADQVAVVLGQRVETTAIAGGCIKRGERGDAGGASYRQQTDSL